MVFGNYRHSAAAPSACHHRMRGPSQGGGRRPHDSDRRSFARRVPGRGSAHLLRQRVSRSSKVSGCYNRKAEGLPVNRRNFLMTSTGLTAAAICDVDESVLNKRVGEVESSGKKRPAAFTDIRKVLEDKSIDAVSIATPNHWHSL